MILEGFYPFGNPLYKSRGSSDQPHVPTVLMRILTDRARTILTRSFPTNKSTLKHPKNKKNPLPLKTISSMQQMWYKWGSRSRKYSWEEENLPLWSSKMEKELDQGAVDREFSCKWNMWSNGRRRFDWRRRICQVGPPLRWSHHAIEEEMRKRSKREALYWLERWSEGEEWW